MLLNIKSYLAEREVLFLHVELPLEIKINGLSDFEKDRIANWCFDFIKYREELPKLKKLYGDDVTQEYINSVFDGGFVVNGATRKVLLDF